MTHNNSAYGEQLAEVYDLLYRHSQDAEDAAVFMAGLAPSGTLLELGVGTGRLALPIADLGLTVTGVDSSPSMLEKLSARDSKSIIRRVEGDMTSIDLGEEFDIVLIGLNTLFMVPSQEQQIAALKTAKSHLGDKGVVVLELYNPDQFYRSTESEVRVLHDTPGSLIIDTVHVDRISQTAVVVHTFINGTNIRKVPEISRWAWLNELDLMAQTAGLELESRFGGYLREPFTAESARHISVYRAV